MCSNFEMMKEIESPPMTKQTVEYNYRSISLQHHSQEGPNKAFLTNKDSIYSAYSLKQKKAFR